MPLRDHFHPPLSDQRRWKSIHAHWIAAIVNRLNDAVLPDRYHAEGEATQGSPLEVDVATFDDAPAPPFHDGSGNGAVATAVRTWAPPRAIQSGAVTFGGSDTFEIQVLYQSGGAKLVAAVELVSPRNKDRPESRRTFATKVASYLAQGVSVVVVDVVTERLANLHADLVAVRDLPPELHWASPTNLSAIAYRVTGTDDPHQVDQWPYALTVGSDLPTLPLWLAPDLAVPLELEPTYAAALHGLRIR